MLDSLRGKLSLLFMAFAILLLISVGATYWGLEAQRQDALVINLAGRQRMLIQQMTRLALESTGEEAPTAHALLEESEETFDKTLDALRDGGAAPYLSESNVVLPGTQNPEIRDAIDDLELAWNQFHANLDAIALSVQETTVDSVTEQSVVLVEKADLVVRLFQAQSVSKINSLRYIQLGFLTCAAALLLAGGWVTRQSLLRPLSELKLAASRLGDNDLHTPIQIQGPEETRSLSHYFDLMRINLLSSQQELVNLNETLERRVAQRTLELEALNEVSQEIISKLEVKQVLNSVTEKARLLLGADVATLCLLDQKHQWLDLEVLSGPDEAIVGDRVPAQSDFATTVLEDDKARMCANLNCAHDCQILEKNFRTSHVVAPLRVGGDVVGAFCVGSPQPNHFSAESAESLTKLANTAAIALENARLYSQAERIATLEERNRIAAEMHDGIGQTLSYLGLMTDKIVDYLAEDQKTDAIEHLHRTRDTINQAAQETRRTINQLLDDSPVNQDLCARLEESIKNFGLQYQQSIDWRNSLSHPAPCSREVAEQVIKIVMEALTNIKRHAEAEQVVVELNKNEDGFYVIVTDNGRGFLATISGQNGHFGLQIMRARAAHIGGKVSIESEPGAGTKVTLSWPEAKREQ